MTARLQRKIGKKADFNIFDSKVMSMTDKVTETPEERFVREKQELIEALSYIQDCIKTQYK